jgi:hypothetical protein
MVTHGRAESAHFAKEMVMKKQHRNRSIELEPLEGRRHMDVTLFDGYLGGGNAPVQVTETLVTGDFEYTTASVTLPNGLVLYPTDPSREALVNAAVPPNPV